MSKPRILFLYNGGTIGQQLTRIDGQELLKVPEDEKAFKAACDPILKVYQDLFDITFEMVTTKDSTNMTPMDWERLVYRVKKAQDEESYDAVAIAHGTDTLAYTATALALALHGPKPGESGLQIPVGLTAAQNCIYQNGGDARFNLDNLFRTLGKGIAENVGDVFVNFWNKVLLGSRLLKTSERKFDAMDSPSFEPVGTIDAHGIKLDIDKLHEASAKHTSINLAPKFGRGVVVFELSPGLEPSVLLNIVSSGGVSALVLKSLGEGIVCSEGEYNLLPAIEKIINDYKVPVFITTKFIGGNAMPTHYEVGYKTIEAGAIPCFDHTDVAVDVKVRWLIGNGLCQNTQDFKKAMGTSFAGEVTAQ